MDKIFCKEIIKCREKIDKIRQTGDNEALLQELTKAYRDDTKLKEESQKWLTILNDVSKLKNIAPKTGFYYTCHSTKFWAKYHYFINDFGIVLLVKEDRNIIMEKDYFYIPDIEDYKNKWWIIPLENGFLSNKKFFEEYNKSDFPNDDIIASDLAVYKLMKEAGRVENCDNNTQTHHIIHNVPHDAVDNRYWNLININKDIHIRVHTKNSENRF